MLIGCFVATAGADDWQIGALAPGEFYWEPELSPSGPLVILIGLPEQTLSAYRNAARFLDRMSKAGRDAPRDALVADLTPQSQRGAAYGLRVALDTIGAVLGPIVAVVLMLSFSGGIRAAMWVALIPAVLAVVVIAVLVRVPEQK